MSFVTMALFNNMNTAMRLDNQYRAMSGSQALMNLANMPNDSFEFSNPQSLMAQERNLTFGNLTAGLMAKIAEVRENSIKKQLDKDIKSSFSTFA